jgi:hypothetical protein
MPEEPRRVIVGFDADGRSTVIRVDNQLPGTQRPTGSTVHELWRQERVPARASDGALGHASEMNPMPPEAGVSIRRLVIPPEVWAGTPHPQTEGPVAGRQYAVRRENAALHRTNSLYVGTVVSGAAYLLLEAGDVLLSVGDTFVLPDSMHSWRNPFDAVAVIVSTAFPLLSDESRPSR